MTLRLIDASEVKGRKGTGDDIGKEEKEIGKGVEKEIGKEEKKEKCACVPVGTAESTTKGHMTILSADKIIRCERREIGLPSSCCICENLNKELFIRCKHKWTDY